jgi:Branched-chain amino acid ABC-type transport system, permease components
VEIDNFVQVAVSGIAMGSIYTLTASGLFIAHLTTTKLNFGQGDFLMVAAFLGMALVRFGVPVPFVILGVVLVLSLFGLILERVAIRPLGRFSNLGSGPLAWILTTIGFGLILQNVVTLIWGGSAQYSPPLFSAARDNVLLVLGVGVYREELAIIAVSVLVIAAFYVFLFRTRWGKAITAVAFNTDTALLLGINVRHTVVLAWVVASVLAGISGVLVGPITAVHPHMGLLFLIKGFAGAIIGGFTNPVGLLIGSLSFGIIEGFSNYFDSSFGDLYPLLLILLFLVVKPAGLFGEAKADVR